MPIVSKRGFTLIEVLVVLAIIASLLAFSLPGMMAALSNGEVRASQVVVDAVACQIIGERSRGGGPTIVLADGRLRHKWDLNNDGIIDGDPDKCFGDDDKLLAANVRSGPYRGFSATLGTAASGRFLKLSTGEVCDAWGKPLRIKFHPTNYGSAGVLIVSYGPDNVEGTADDISSKPGER